MDINYQITNENGGPTDDKKSLWIKYSFSLAISKISKTYTSGTEAKHAPLASKIFGFPWVEEVKVSPHDVLLKRQTWVDFDIIAAPLKDLMKEHFENFKGQNLEENPEAPQVTPQTTEGLTEEATKVVQFLDQEVNPQVAAHGGRIGFVDLKDKKLYLKMEGGCQGCGQAQATLKDGVETALKENFDFIDEVIDTTDHAQGVKPYFS